MLMNPSLWPFSLSKYGESLPAMSESESEQEAQEKDTTNNGFIARIKQLVTRA